MVTINSIQTVVSKVTCKDAPNAYDEERRIYAHFQTYKNGVELLGKIEVTDEIQGVLGLLTAKIEKQLGEE